MREMCRDPVDTGAGDVRESDVAPCPWECRTDLIETGLWDQQAQHVQSYPYEVWRFVTRLITRRPYGALP